MSDETTLTEGSVVPSALAIERTGYGEGFSEADALLHWLQTDPELMKDGVSFGMDAFDKTKPVHVNQIRQPVLPKRVTKTMEPKVEGSKAWKTMFVVRDVDGAELGAFEKRGEALALAKEVCLRDLVTVTIDKEKRLASGSTRIMTLAPKNSKPGKFKFKASFKY